MKQILGKGSVTPAKDKEGKVIPHRWRVRLRYTDDDGKLRWTPLRTVRGTKSDAQRVAEEIRQEYETKINSIGTVANYARQWHEDRKRSGTYAENTIIRDESVIDHLCEAFKDDLMEELRPEAVENVYQHWRDNGWSEDAIFKHHSKLSQIYRHAKKRNKLQFNPCDCVDVRRPRENAKHSLSLAQFKKLVTILENSPKSGEIVAVYLALMTGTRKGETLGLEWSHVDLGNKCIHIRYQYCRRKSHKALKTPHSIRTITISQRVADFLTDWREWQSEHIFGGKEVPGHYPVCSHYSRTRDFDSAHLVLSPFRKWLMKFFISNGITYEDMGEVKPYTFHELRHSHASQEAAAGVDVKTLQSRMGHADISTTLNIYTHVIDEKERQAADLLDAILD